MRGEIAVRAAAALRWLLAAHDATDDDGVSYGYFPASRANGWDISYPETTGYIITSVINYSRRVRRQDLVDRAIRMARWEADVQMPSGAVQGGKVTDTERQSPAAFNTGMVLDGFVSVLEQRTDEVILSAAMRAADFLLSDLDKNGLFRTNGAFVSSAQVKVYNVLCAWAMYRLGCLNEVTSYRNAAVRAVEGALTFQRENGWFAENCLSDPLRPLTHTIGYTAQGILEVGAAAEREDFVAAARRCLDGIVGHVMDNGCLSGRFDSEWRPAVPWVCLTGSAQIAIVAYRLSALCGQPEYASVGDRLVNFLKTLQSLDCGVSGIDGALSGTYPIHGPYMSLGYPNWATKYFLDALMLQADRENITLVPA